MRFLTVLLQLIFSCCGRTVDHAGKSESFQSFLIFSIIPTRKTLITTVGLFLLSQIPRHIIPWTWLSSFAQSRRHNPWEWAGHRGIQCMHKHMWSTHSHKDTMAYTYTQKLSPVQQVSHSSPGEGDVYIYSLWNGSVTEKRSSQRRGSKAKWLQRVFALMTASIFKVNAS